MIDLVVIHPALGLSGEMRYLNDEAVTSAAITDTPWKGRTVTGYGGSLPTRYTLTLSDGRTRRVKAMCYSNAVSYYVTVAGVLAHLGIETESRLQELSA